MRTPELPSESKQLELWVHNKFRDGLSLSGREVRELFPKLVFDFNLPLPLHQAALAFTQVSYLLYGGSMPRVPWRLHGLLATFILHVVMEHLEKGATATLYMHGLLKEQRKFLFLLHIFLSPVSSP